MSLTFGFYNSLNGDRKYDTVQMSSIFDGIIVDGIFASIGTAFVVKAAGGNKINVGTGRAWFNHTWTLNDAILPMEASESELLLNRIDAVVLEVNATDAVRANSIKIIQGEPASEPVRPTLVDDVLVHQHALCYIYRAAESTEITQADITNAVGTDETPFVTGMLQTISLDELLGQWQDELGQFVASESADIDAFVEDRTSYMDEWIEDEQASFTEWFDGVKGQLSGDVAGNLQEQINELNDSISDTHKIKEVILLADDWVTGTTSTQTVVIEGTTANSKVDLQPDSVVLKQMIDDGVSALYIINDNGTLTACAMGSHPTVDLTIQCTVIEVSV